MQGENYYETSYLCKKKYAHKIYSELQFNIGKFYNTLSIYAMRYRVN